MGRYLSDHSQGIYDTHLGMFVVERSLLVSPFGGVFLVSTLGTKDGYTLVDVGVLFHFQASWHTPQPEKNIDAIDGLYERLNIRLCFTKGSLDKGRMNICLIRVLQSSFLDALSGLNECYNYMFVKTIYVEV